MESPNVTLVLAPKKYNTDLAEINQYYKIRFSFCVKTAENTYEQVTSSVQCREFFNEFLMKIFHPTEVDLSSKYFGFCYDHEKQPWNPDKPAMSMKFFRKGGLTTFMQNLSILNEFEQYLQFSATQTYLVNTDTIVIEFDPSWCRRTLVFNMYTQLLKILAQMKEGRSWNAVQKIAYNDYAPQEIMYIDICGIRGFTNLLNHIPEMLSTESKYVDGRDLRETLGIIHGSSGVCAVKRMVDRPTVSSFTQTVKDMLIKAFKTKKENEFQFFTGVA